MPIALTSLMVGDWKSPLSNLGGTGPDPTGGGAGRAAAVVLALLEVEISAVAGSTDTRRDVDVQEGSLEAGGLTGEGATSGAEETATVGADEAEASACLALFLAAAVVHHYLVSSAVVF